MNRVNPKMQDFAKRLIAYEARGNKSSRTKPPAAFAVAEKLRGPLGRLMGVGGFCSLLSRALALAGADVSGLRALQIKADGSLAGLDELMTKLDPRAIADGEVALVAQLLGLLVTFIGPALTRGLLEEIWPKLELNFNE